MIVLTFSEIKKRLEEDLRSNEELWEDLETHRVPTEAEISCNWCGDHVKDLGDMFCSSECESEAMAWSMQVNNEEEYYE